MAHPHFRAATVQAYQNGLVKDYTGKPAMFPPVTAMNEDDEERLKADGYEPAGHVDPSAWVRAHSDVAADVYVPQKYPLWRDGVLYMTAQEDPGAEPADLVTDEPAGSDAPVPTRAVTPDANLAAQMEAMQDTMRQMNEAMVALAEENKALKEAPAAAPKPRGRPPKADV
jgi:hypothetical protein